MKISHDKLEIFEVRLKNLRDYFISPPEKKKESHKSVNKLIKFTIIYNILLIFVIFQLFEKAWADLSYIMGESL